MGRRDREAKRFHERIGSVPLTLFIVVVAVLLAGAHAQTDCAEGNGVLDMSPPKNMTPQDLIQKFAAEETKVKEARNHYTYTQDLLVQTLDAKGVDGQFHQISHRVL